MQDFILIISGLISWVLGAYWLLKGATMLSIKFQIPKILVGATLVSLATSVPELLLSVKAVTNDMPDLALGNAIGANIANLGLVLAIVIMVSGVAVNKSSYATPWSVMMLASILFFGFIYFDGEIQRYEGFFMLVALLLLLVYLLWSQRNARSDVWPRDDRPLPSYGIVLFLGLGGLAIWGGSEILLKGMFKYMTSGGVDGRIFAITVLSLGTTIPELAVAVFAIIKKQKAILLGNLIGSNMFNLLGVLGVSAMKRPIKVMDPGLLFNDIFWMLGVSFILLPLMFFSKGQQLSWKKGLVLLGIYLVFAYFTLI